MKVTTAELLIEPIGYCNLACKYCYTKHTRDALPPKKILSFVERYVNYVNLPRGRGEVTLYPHLAGIINLLSNVHGKRISFYIQTNGILIRQVIEQLNRLDNLEISISLDGFEQVNDANRGQGTFHRIVQNIIYLSSLGIPVNVQTILHPGNYRDAKRFQEYIRSLGNNISLEFFDVLTREEVTKYESETHILPPISAADPAILEMRHALTAPDYDFVHAVAKDQDVYPSVLCDGRVATCCEFQNKIGTIDTDIATLLSKLDLKLCAHCPIRSRCNANRIKELEKNTTQALMAIPRVVLNK